MRGGAGKACRDSSGEASGGDGEIDQLDADERHHDPAQAVDQEIAAQEAGGTDRLVVHATQGQRDQGEMISALKMMADRIAPCGLPAP